jgi:hypothetical protein
MLAYSAVAPWPVVESNGNLDWVAAVDCVEEWLCSCIGAHSERWDWNLLTLHNPCLCSVRFAHERDSTLFLLRFS